jgi:hypothetical protein
MADPVIVAIPTGDWVKVATNVLTGQIHRKKNNVVYKQTYRQTGQPAPLITELDEGVPLFADGPAEAIIANEGIDVYIWAIDKNGEVRVDV